MDQARSGRRYAVSQPLAVRCESWGEFVALYAADISQGGMFIVTDDPPSVLSEIDVQLKLPEGHEIPLRARVVHVIDAAQAAHARREPGVGVEFIGIDGPMQAQIHQLIEFARWQGSAQQPTATLASHLFELSASARPAELMQSLPPATTPREAIPSARVVDGETASSGVRRASGAPAVQARVSKPASDAPRRRRTESQPAASNQPAASDQPEAPAEAASGQPAPPAPPKPTDLEKLKLGMKHLGAKRFGDALKHFQGMLDDNPGDPEVLKWQNITMARKAIASNNGDAAHAAYLRVLSISEDVHEARKFVREHEQKKKLAAIPFGRFFVKKK